MVQFGIIIGLILSFLVSFGIIYCLSIFAGKYTDDNGGFMGLLLDARVGLSTVIPVLSIVITTILSYLIVIISSLLPIRKINKISPIDAIKEYKNSDLKAKMMNCPKIIGKFLGIEGELAYKNIKKDKSRYKTIVVSIVISIVLFLAIKQAYSISTYTYGNFDYGNDVEELNASIYISGENSEKAIDTSIKFLMDNDLADYCISVGRIDVNNEKNFNRVKLMTSFPKSELTEKGKKLYDNDLLGMYDYGRKIFNRCFFLYCFWKLI